MSNATKTIGQILHDNICTVFNLLNLIIAIALAMVGAWKNILFFLIIIINTVIGIIQEIKAKRQIEKLTILTQPIMTIFRRDEKKDVLISEIQKDDMLVLTAGSIICTDCITQEGQIEVNEAILTGESEPVVKKVGDQLLSGSSVISGNCLAKAICSVEECSTEKMVKEVKNTKGSYSELLSSMKKVTNMTSFIIVPLGILLFVQAYFFRNTSLDIAVISTSAGLLGMLPKGLVLLISIGLAVGVIRLSKKNVLVRDLHSLENLAHCDIVCLDKTGTLTEGKLEVEKVYSYIDKQQLNRLMATYLSYSTDNNATYQAISYYFSSDNPYEISNVLPFSSERKYSSVTFTDGKRLILGAPEKLCSNISTEVENIMAQGKRVLYVGLCPNEAEMDNINVVAIIVIVDKLRKNAKQTIQYFYHQDMDVKIISGDNPISVATVAKLSGVKNADSLVDVTGISDEALELIAEKYTVFGRVTPQQKKVLISALQKQGHKIAMTGDGVNDLLAMRQADCSIAMGSGSDAAKQTAQLVLLDSDFSVLKDVISEGRRVVNNLTKSAGVFFIKTIYSVLLSIICLLLNADFPFIPIQITLIDAVIEAFPAFFMSFEKNDRKVVGTFLGNAYKSALPNSLAIVFCCCMVFLIAPRMNIADEQVKLIAYLIVGTISLFGVIKASKPFNLLHVVLSIFSIFGYFIAVLLFAPLLQLAPLTLNSFVLLFFMIIFGILFITFFKMPVLPKIMKLNN